MPKIVITEFMTKGAVDDLARDYDVVYETDLFERPDDLIALVGDAEGLIVRNRTQVTANLLDAAPRLRVIGRLGVGLDNLDMEACAARNIPVYPATGANDASVAEYVIASAFHLIRRAFHATSRILDGEWPRQAFVGEELQGRCLGLIGFGSIARVLARKAESLDLKILAYDPHLAEGDPAWKEVSRVAGLTELLTSADIVSLHIPRLPSTEHLIDSAAIASMKPGAILINAARGGIVDEDALAEALRSGHLSGAALDVLETEPPTKESIAKFKGLTNLILTPHIAGPTIQSDIRVSGVTAENVRHVLSSPNSDGDRGAIVQG
ncbi:MAG: hydroxyacid dehydrogenase [Pseudomonadota bacterium]